MPLVKNAYPILEYDSEPVAVLMPGKKNILPRKCVYGFLGDYVEQFAVEHGLPVAAEYRMLMKSHLVYTTDMNGVEIAICSAPVGAACATAILDWLIGHGVREIVAIGGCGALADFPENEMFIPVAALRDEGTSYKYLPPAREIELDRGVADAIKRSLDAQGIKSEFVKTWTTDGLYRETKDMVAYRKAEGCTVVEMECSAMAACARFRGASFGQILFTQDSLANPDKHDERTWGEASFGVAIGIALEAARGL